MRFDDLFETLNLEQRKVLMPWSAAWAVVIGLEFLLCGGLVFCYLITNSIDPRIFIAVFIAGQGLRSLFSVIWMLKMDQLTGQTPKWRHFILPLAMGIVAIAVLGSLFMTS